MTNLNEYLERENSDISEQYRYFNQIDKILTKLPKSLENKLSKIKDEPHRENFGETIKRQKLQTLMRHPEKNSLQEIFNDKMKKLVNSQRQNRSCNHRIIELSACNAGEKMKQYRQDLLKQIEDKRKSKMEQDQLERREQILLENKVMQQRLSLYLEYLDEHQKQTTNHLNPMLNIQLNENNDQQEQSKCGSNKSNKSQQSNIHHTVHVDEHATNEDHSRCHQELSQESSSFTTTAAQTLSPYIKLITELPTEQNTRTKQNPNILTDLNAVRKIMQNDHYELLEKLFELNI